MAEIRHKQPAFVLPDLVLGLSLMALAWGLVLPLGGWLTEQGERLKLDLGFAAVTGYLSQAQQCAMYLHNGPVTVTIEEQGLAWRYQDYKADRLSCRQLGLENLRLHNPSEVKFTGKGSANAMFRLAVVNPALPDGKKTVLFQPVTGRLVFEGEADGRTQQE